MRRHGEHFASRRVSPSLALGVATVLWRRFGLRDLDSGMEMEVTEERREQIELFENHADIAQIRLVLAFMAECTIGSDEHAQELAPREAGVAAQCCVADRGLRSAMLVIADDHNGPSVSARRVVLATQQSCCIHCIGNALTHAPAEQRSHWRRFWIDLCAGDRDRARDLGRRLGRKAAQDPRFDG